MQTLTLHSPRHKDLGLQTKTIQKEDKNQNDNVHQQNNVHGNEVLEKLANTRLKKELLQQYHHKQQKSQIKEKPEQKRTNI